MGIGLTKIIVNDNLEMSLTTLQIQYTSAVKVYNQALTVVSTLNSSIVSTQTNINAKKTEITNLQAKLASMTVTKQRATIQAQIYTVQLALNKLNKSLVNLQTLYVSAITDQQKKKDLMDGLAIQLANAQAAIVTPPTLVITPAPVAPVVPVVHVVPAAPVAPTQIFKRALLVGVNYVGTQYELAGCINDVKNMKTQLQTFFPSLTDSNITLLTDETTVKPTKANILSNISTLLSGLKPGENVMFHFSGHGGRIIDKNGDEVSGYDSCIYPLNGSSLETISDDELRTALATKVPIGCKCLTVLDSCHSGSAVDLRYLWETTPTGGLTYTEDKKYEKTNGDVLFLSGAKDTQTAADTVDTTSRPCGALTWALLDTWRTYGPAIKTKYLLADVRKFLKDRGYSQVPMLSTGKYIDLQTVFTLG